MSDEQSIVTLRRLGLIDWADSWNPALAHAQSRRLLMHEYLRRSALWANHFDAESSWPFFDITESIDSQFQLPPDVSGELEDLLRKVSFSARKTCAGAVRLAGMSPLKFGSNTSLPDLYEPLILFYERGGEFLQDGAGFIDLTGVSIKLKSLADHLDSMPFLSFRTTTLDAMDAEGAISYYKATGPTSSIIRRRFVDTAGNFDEIIRSSGSWEQTDELKLTERGVSDTRYTQIGDIEAARTIEHLIEVSL
ncbi:MULTISPECIES: hypothetical protein [unclassified Streptomyces]|uniref:hypothetical protein n=1 Tax=unclassified Streptomyces TaxID=2593676 RepID=UPI00379C1F64